MVAKITSPSSIKRVLNYNEQKVQKGVAECIYAGNFLKNADMLNFYQKLNRFQNLISLNSRTEKTNTLHITLNFHPDDKLDQEKFRGIAKTYMQRIGFANQPYLVYTHHDSGHPHIHIVTTTITSEGNRINTFNIGRLLSEPARKEIERLYGLTVAEGRKLGSDEKIKLEVVLEKLEYGKSETKRSITDILDKVLNQYNFNSLNALNVILKDFNVCANPGAEGSRLKNNRGLLYHILDKNGDKIGVPIKASSIYNKPTMAFLEKLFLINEQKRILLYRILRRTIDTALLLKPKSMENLIELLEKQGIKTLLRHNESGFAYGITFTDHKNKWVCNGSELGKKYAYSGFQKIFEPKISSTLISQLNSHQTKKISIIPKISNQTQKQHFPNHVLRNLLKPEFEDPGLLLPLKRKKKKKKYNPDL